MWVEFTRFCEGFILPLLPFVGVGLAAQLVDGALGMAYGVTSNSFLLGLGLSPSLASSAVHIAEVFTTLLSGISHWRLGNINKKLFVKIVLPGMIGGGLGAYVLAGFPGGRLKPLISFYLLIMGARILRQAFKTTQVRNLRTPSTWMVSLVGLISGLLDAMGGGGWGPVGTTTFLSLFDDGSHPRRIIGTINAAEFFVTLTESVTFLAALGVSAVLANWRPILGLLIGGAVMAPLAAVACRRLPRKTLMMVVGSFIILLSLRTLFLSV